MRKRIVIFTASIGSGHDQAAENLKRQLLAIGPGVDVEVIDFMNILHPTISQFILSTYLKLIDLFPSVYHYIYHITEKISTQGKVSDLITYRYQKKITRLLSSKYTDMIVFTNPFPAALVSSLKKRGRVNIPTATIITDYTAHSVWLDEMTDMYFVGCDELKQDLIKRGVSSKKIIVSGIPIHEKFDLPIDKVSVAREIGLDPNLPTVLVMGGGLGIGPIKEVLDIVEGINCSMQILVVAGSNDQLKTELEARTYGDKHMIKIFGYCNNMHELMTVSELLISKSGGLTMTESISRGLPIIVVDPIPGQEVVNATHFSNLGAARLIEDLSGLKDCIIELLFINPEKRSAMVKRSYSAAKPNAAKNIASILLVYLEKLYGNDLASITK